MRNAAMVILAVGACVGTSGCVTAAMGAAASVGVAMAQERTVGQALDDATGGAEIKTRLIAADRNGFGEVDVELANGRLLLSGPVPTMEHRIEAERLAWSVSRVQAVANEITVGPRSGLLRSAMDEMITAQVRARLIASSSVRSIDVNIETNQGSVYLMGLARSTEEIESAAQIASITPGVQRVVSYMQVRQPGEHLARPERSDPVMADGAEPAPLPVGSVDNAGFGAAEDPAYAWDAP